MSLPATILAANLGSDMATELGKLFMSNEYEMIVADTDTELNQHLIGSSHFDLILTAAVAETHLTEGVITKVKQYRPQLPVVLITAKKRIAALLESTQLGADDYVTLPLDEVRIQKVVRNAVTVSRRVSRPASLEGIELSENRKFADYDLKGIVGSGGAGVVYLAQKIVQGEKLTCALKILHPVGDRNEEQNRDVLERFLREAEMASRLSDPNIVQILDFGLNEESLTPFIAMEFFSGRSLRQYIRAPDEPNLLGKISIIKQVALALQAIHSNNFCHRDIKPENVLVETDLMVKVTDFGIARMPNSELTQTMKVLGTPSYMAPEAFSSSKVDPPADLFSLGVVAYELFLGRRPFTAPSIGELRMVIRNEPPLAPRKIDPAFPLSLENVLAKLLKKDPAKRMQTAGELIDCLDDIVAKEAQPPKTEFMSTNA